MKQSVKITGDSVGNVIIPAENNPEFGHIRVEQSRITFDDKCWAKRKTISALIHGTIDDLKSLEVKVGDTLPGKVVVKESLEPFNVKDPERDFKVAGKTNVICKFEGEPIYRKTFYSPNVDIEDELIQHTNSEEIRLAHKTDPKTEESERVDAL